MKPLDDFPPAAREALWRLRERHVDPEAVLMAFEFAMALLRPLLERRDRQWRDRVARFAAGAGPPAGLNFRIGDGLLAFC